MKAKSIFRFANENSSAIINSQSNKHFFDITNSVNNIYYLDARINNKFKWITFTKQLVKQYNLTYTKKLYTLNKNYNDILERQIKQYFNHWKFRFQWRKLIKKLLIQNSRSIFNLFLSQVHDEIRQDHFEKWYKLSNKLLREFRIDNLIDIYSIETNNKLKKNCFLSWKETFNKHSSYIDNLREKWATLSFYFQEKERIRLLRKERRKLRQQLKWIRLNHLLYLSNIENEYDYYILRKKWKLLCKLILKSNQTNSLIQAKRRIQYRDTFRLFSFKLVQINHHKKIESEYKSYIRKRTLHEMFKKYNQLVRHEDLIDVYQLYQKKLDDKNNKRLLKSYVKRWNIISHIMKNQRNFMRISFKKCIDDYYLAISNASAKIIQKYFRIFLKKRKESKKLLYHWFIKWRQTPRELTYDTVEFPHMSLIVRLKKMKFSFHFDFLKPKNITVFNVLSNVYQFNEFEEKVKDATSKALEKITFKFPNIPNSTHAIENVASFHNMQHKIDRVNSEIINNIIPKIDLYIPNDLFSNHLSSSSKYIEKDVFYSDSKLDFNEQIYSPKLSLKLLFGNQAFRHLNTGILSNEVNRCRKKCHLRDADLDLSKPLRQLKIKLDSYKYPISFKCINFLNELPSNKLHNKTRFKGNIASNISNQIPNLQTDSSKHLEALEANKEKSRSFSNDNSIDISKFMHLDLNLPTFIPKNNILKSLSFLENTSNNINLSKTVTLNDFQVRNTPNFNECIKKLPNKSLNKLQNFELVHKYGKSCLHQNSFDATIEEEEEDTDSDTNASFNDVSEDIVKQFNIEIQDPLLNTTKALDAFELNSKTANISFDISLFDIELSFKALEKDLFNENSNGLTSFISNSRSHLHLFSIYRDLNIHHMPSQEISDISSQITDNFKISMPCLGSSLTKFSNYQYHPKIQLNSNEIEQSEERELIDSDENNYFEIGDEVNETIKTPKILLPNSMSKAISIMRSFEINNVGTIGYSNSIDLNHDEFRFNNDEYDGILSNLFQNSIKVLNNFHFMNYTSPQNDNSFGTNISSNVDNIETLSNFSLSFNLRVHNSIDTNNFEKSTNFLKRYEINHGFSASISQISGINSNIQSTHIDKSILKQKEKSIHMLSNFKTTNDLCNDSETRAKGIANEIPFYFSIEPGIFDNSRQLFRMNCLNNQSKAIKRLNS